MFLNVCSSWKKKLIPGFEEMDTLIDKLYAVIDNSEDAPTSRPTSKPLVSAKEMLRRM